MFRTGLCLAESAFSVVAVRKGVKPLEEKTALNEFDEFAKDDIACRFSAAVNAGDDFAASSQPDNFFGVYGSHRGDSQFVSVVELGGCVDGLEFREIRSSGCGPQEETCAGQNCVSPVARLHDVANHTIRDAKLDLPWPRLVGDFHEPLASGNGARLKVSCEIPTEDLAGDRSFDREFADLRFDDLQLLFDAFDFL